MEERIELADYVRVGEGQDLSCYSYGGSQSWFDDHVSSYGCGLIAASDTLLCLMNRAGQKDLHYDQASYEAWVSGLIGDPFHVIKWVGVPGTFIASGMKKVLKAKGTACDISWCVSHQKRLERIEEMLKAGLPVIFSIGPNLFKRKPKGVWFFVKEDREVNEKALGPLSSFKAETMIDGHYVTITGLVRGTFSLTIPGEGQKLYTGTMVKISSWGRIYYICYDEYETYVSRCSNAVFSNICLIRENE